MGDERLGFDNVPEVYDRVRPTYPDELFDDLFAYVDVPPGQTVRAVEIGPGTGKATRSLLERGIELTAVEIGANLAAFLRNKFAGESRLSVINGSFEEAELLPGGYDLVCAATAFHWVEAEVRYTKSYALLRPAGAIGIIETNQIADQAVSEFFERVHQVVLKYRPGEEWAESPGEDVTPAIFDEVRECGLFADVSLRRYRWDQTYSADEYADLVRSFGGTQAMEPAAAEAMVADQRELVVEHGGSITRPLVMTLTLARKP